MSSPSEAGSRLDRPRTRPDFERIALLLQGGGALGSYQGGVYQALFEANLHPDWVAGIRGRIFLGWLARIQYASAMGA
jgi:NTE family protein